MTSKDNRTPLLYYIKLCASFQSHRWNWSCSPETLNSGKKLAIFCPVWPWNLTNDLQNRQGIFSILHHAVRIIPKPLKTIGHLFYATSSSVHNFVAINVLKLEFQSESAQFGSKSAIDVPCDLEILRMTLKNNRAPLLIQFKRCASFCSHWWIQTGVTFRKPLIRSQLFLSPVTCDRWPWKTIGHLFYATSCYACASFRSQLWIHCTYGSEKPKSGLNLLWHLWSWPLTSDLDLLHGHLFCPW